MDLQAQTNNHVKISVCDRRGKIVSEQTAKNQSTFAWANVVVNALLRSAASQVTYLYARFGDSGANPGTLNPPNNDLRYTLRSTFLASSDSIRGGLWVPLLAPPQQVTSDPTLYNGNQANYPFALPANISASQISPADNFNVNTSYIYALGLAVSPDITDRTQDIIIEVLETFTPFPIPSGGQVLVTYPVQMQVLPPT